MKISGIVAYPITPFSSDERSINFEILGHTLESLIDNDSDVIAPLGSTGEGAYLSFNEWREVADFTIKIVNKRTPVIIGISELTTFNAIIKAKYAESIGADAIMVIPVSYWKLSDSEIFSYYQEIAKEISLPIMVYNNPATSGIDMSPELLIKMYNGIENVTMIKESTGDIQRMHKIFELSAGKCAFFNGCNTLALEALCAGASGWCTAAPNIIGNQPKALFDSVVKGDLSSSQKIFYRQLPILRFIVGSGIPQAIKAGLILKGIAAGLPRKPLQGLSREDALRLKALMNEFEA